MKASELKLISWTAALVVVLGIASILSLLQKPQSFEVIAQHAVTAGRSIASIPAPAKAEFHSVLPAVIAELQTFDVKASCTSAEPIKIAESIRQVRISGTNCSGSGSGSGSVKVLTTEIQNVSNGFAATVFHPSAKSFTTDYVTLIKGANRILVREHLGDGKTREREYQITRNQKL